MPCGTEGHLPGDMAVSGCGRTVDKLGSTADATHHAPIIPGGVCTGDTRRHAGDQSLQWPSPALESVSATTFTVSSKTTPPTSSTRTLCSPTVLIGSSRTRSFRSMTAPVCSSTCRTMSAADTEPNSRSPAARADHRDRIPNQCPGNGLGRLVVAGITEIPRPSHRRGLALQTGEATMAFLAGSRWLRANPPDTSMMSPRLPTPSISLRSRTFISALAIFYERPRRR